MVNQKESATIAPIHVGELVWLLLVLSLSQTFFVHYAPCNRRSVRGTDLVARRLAATWGTWDGAMRI